MELWSISATGSFEFDALADSLYTVVATAPGYGTLTIAGIRVENGTSQNVLFEFTGGSNESAMPDQPWATPLIDGTLEDDWNEIYNDGGHVGLWNLVNMDYDSLHVSWDEDSLYLAASGNFAGTYNSLNLYIDADYGEGTGLSDLSLINGEDDYATVVNRLNKLVNFDAVPDFGAEFATSTWGHVDLALSSLAPDGTTVALGRGAIAASADALELSIPWSVLYPGLGGDGVVPPYAQIAVFALIGSNSNSAMSDDSLPIVDDLNAPDSVVVIPIDEDGQ
ncbi:carboxypeptidase regulatory-like domain-containing protein [bacterium]|nr:carboxypeptidase regulatory-like domain-containing protein [bacterium]